MKIERIIFPLALVAVAGFAAYSWIQDRHENERIKAAFGMIESALSGAYESSSVFADPWDNALSFNRYNTKIELVLGNLHSRACADLVQMTGAPEFRRRGDWVFRIQANGILLPDRLSSTDVKEGCKMKENILIWVGTPYGTGF